MGPLLDLGVQCGGIVLERDVWGVLVWSYLDFVELARKFPSSRVSVFLSILGTS